MQLYFSLALISVYYVSTCCGHGRLVDPPGRASAWRYGFNTPRNYDDNQLFCGGREVQWNQNGGKCGVCGDPYSGPRDHEAGGRFATGTIVETYKPGHVITVKVELTANHKGWFEFHLCPNNDPMKRVTERCLNRGLLPLANGAGSRFPVSSEMRLVSVDLRLPQDMTCTQCVLQWKYNAGNSWGVDSQTGEGCIGCGPQEQFYGCADIAIGHNQGASSANRPGPGGNSHREGGNDRSANRPRPGGNSHREGDNDRSANRPRPGGNSHREGDNERPQYTSHKTLPKQGISRKDRTQRKPSWRSPLAYKIRASHRLPVETRRLQHGGANRNQQHGGANRNQQQRSNSGSCMAHPDWSSNQGMDKWCQDNCERGYCPETHCVCV